MFLITQLITLTIFVQFPITYASNATTTKRKYPLEQQYVSQKLGYYIN